MSVSYVVIYEQAEDGGWGAICPTCLVLLHSATTRVEVAERIQEALTAYSEELRERGESCPLLITRPARPRLSERRRCSAAALRYSASPTRLSLARYDRRLSGAPARFSVFCAVILLLTPRSPTPPCVSPFSSFKSPFHATAYLHLLLVWCPTPCTRSGCGVGHRNQPTRPGGTGLAPDSESAVKSGSEIRGRHTGPAGAPIRVRHRPA